MYATLYEKICSVGYKNSDIYLFITVKQASPLPQAAHIGVSWVQRVTQTNQEATKQKDSRALQSLHGPEGGKGQTFTEGCMNPNTLTRMVQTQNIFLLY